MAKTRTREPADSAPAGNGGDGKTSMIEVAERLFAEGGLNGVSMREIASKAGQGNHFAVQYHFGSREGLVQAIFVHRMQQMEPTRARLLAEAEAAGRLKDARTLLKIIYLPQLELQNEDGRHTYAGFLVQYLLQHRTSQFGDFGPETPPNLTRLLSLLRDRLDYLPGPVAQRRLMSCNLMFLNILVNHGDPDWRERMGETFEDALEDTLDLIVICMTAPLRLSELPSG